MLGCKSDHLDVHYRRYPAFKLAHQFFCEPSRIAASSTQRTALALCNIDTRKLEGLWEAVSNNGQVRCPTAHAPHSNITLGSSSGSSSSQNSTGT